MRSFIPLAFCIAILMNACQVTIDTNPGHHVEDTTEPSTEEPTTEPESEPEPQPSNAELKLAELSLHEKICQLFIVHPEALTPYRTLTFADDTFYAGYDQFPVGGFIFFAQNFNNAVQSYNLTSDIQRYASDKGVGVFLSTDEEGGTLTRIQKQLGTAPTYNMSWYGSNNDYGVTRDAGRTIGQALSDYCINLDFAPVADVNISPKNELGVRIFSSDPDVVARMSGAIVDGLHDLGICSTLKHFPGLGAGNGNTHYGSVYIDRSMDQLRETEFKAFSGGIESGADFVMVGHQITSASGDDRPGDLSRVVVTDWLRGELGFNGIAITDSQSMGAIINNYNSADAAVMSIEAGMDVILMPYNLSTAVEGVKQAIDSGRLTEERIDESVLRILEKKEKLGLITVETQQEAPAEESQGNYEENYEEYCEENYEVE